MVIYSYLNKSSLLRLLINTKMFAENWTDLQKSSKQ